MRMSGFSISNNKTRKLIYEFENILSPAITIVSGLTKLRTKTLEFHRVLS